MQCHKFTSHATPFMKLLEEVPAKMKEYTKEKEDLGLGHKLFSSGER